MQIDKYGIKDLEEKLEAIKTGEIICFASTPNRDMIPCKLVLEILRNIKVNGKILYFNTEISKECITNYFKEYYSIIKKKLIEINCCTINNIDDLINTVFYDENVELLIIDDINCIKKTFSVNDTVTKLKNLAISKNIAILFTFMLHRNIEIEDNYIPTISDCQKSGLDIKLVDKIFFI